VVVGEPGLGDGEPTGLLEEIIKYAPAGVAKPGRDNVADHGPDPGGGKVGEPHAIGLTGNISHEAVADGEIDLGVGRADRMERAVERLADYNALAMDEGPVAVAIARLPVLLGRMARSDPEVGLTLVEARSNLRGRVLGTLEALGYAANFLDPALAGAKLIEPVALVHTFGGEGRASADSADDQRGGRDEAQGVLRGTACDDSPAEVGIGIGIHPTGEGVHAVDGLGTELGGASNPANMQGVEGSERRLYRREITLEGQDLGPMGLNESRDHFVPARCGQGLAGDEDSVSIGPKRSCWEEGGRQE
jgi:hypothetical protein